MCGWVRYHLEAVLHTGRHALGAFPRPLICVSCAVDGVVHRGTRCPVELGGEALGSPKPDAL